MEKDFETEDFQFTPPEFDMALAGENVDTDTSFTAPSVENTLEEEVPFENPSLQVEVIPEPEVEAKTEENKSEQTFDDFDNVMPNPEDLTQFEVTQAEDTVEAQPEEAQKDTAEIQDTVETQPEDAQDKIANAIREKMSEMQSPDTPDITESNEAAPSFEPVMEEEIQISPTPEPYQEEPVSKDEMFVEGKEKLKNMIANESQQSINLIKEDVLTK